MKITIENCSSPGASFTKNTDYMILSNYDWIEEHDDETEPFVDFRKKVCDKYNISNDNARNIYPLLKNCELVTYEKGGNIRYSIFFTATGKAYAKTLDSIRSLEKRDVVTAKDKAAIGEFEKIKQQIILKGLKHLIEPNKTNYSNELRFFIEYTHRYGKINKYEFAYMLHMLQQNNTGSILEEMNDVVKGYRHNNVDIEVSVNVRNDIEVREKSNKSRRNEGISFLTSYSYFSGLLEQAGLIKRTRAKDSYAIVLEGAEEKFEELLGGQS